MINYRVAWSKQNRKLRQQSRLDCEILLRSVDLFFISARRLYLHPSVYPSVCPRLSVCICISVYPSVKRFYSFVQCIWYPPRNIGIVSSSPFTTTVVVSFGNAHTPKRLVEDVISCLFAISS